MEKRFRIVPRGVALVIGCSTFPTWNGYPGFFAEPRHRQRRRRQAASERDPAARDHREDRARGAARGGLRSERRHAGRARRGRRHRADARAAARDQDHRFHRQHRERPLARGARPPGAGLHREGRRQPGHHRLGRRFQGRSCATSRSRSSLYTGQMCTAPQNIYVPKDGIDTAEGHLSFDQVAAGLAEGVEKLLADPARARSRCSAPLSTKACCAGSRPRARSATIALDTRTIAHPQFPEATIRTPLIVKLDAGRSREVSERMVRADRVRHRDRRHRRKPARSRATRSWGTAR